MVAQRAKLQLGEMEGDEDGVYENEHLGGDIMKAGVDSSGGLNNDEIG